MFHGEEDKMRVAKRISFIMFMILFLFAAVSVSGQDEKKKIITVTPGKQYKAGAIFKVFFGSHWRHLWTTPVQVEVLDLRTFAGGLTPQKRGGGMQTKSLRFKGADGHVWKFRSMDKDPQSVLPKALRDTLAKSVVQDQISSANPMAALVLAPILNAVGILQAEPFLVWMPDDEGLGKFRKEFGGVLGTIEIHPKGKDKDPDGFAGAKKIINTFDLYKRLENNRDERVDSADFLKARLVDVFVGDWDRHSDQWLWAYYKENKKKMWNPIPRDRDQAFAKLNGILPWFTRYLIIHLCHFDTHYPPVKKMTWSGRFVDRRLLSTLDRATWESVTQMVQSKLTDQVIEEAVKRLPPEHYKKAGKEMIAKLRSRRDTLTQFSMKYFKEINKVIDIFTSDKDDFVEVNRIDNKRTEIKVYKYGKKKKDLKKGKPYIYKMVDNNLTYEIRIYLEGGDDRVEVKGVVNSSPLVRVVGGAGKDLMIDKSHVKGYFMHIIPIPKAETKTIFYDSGKKSIFKRSAGTKVVRHKEPKPANNFQKYESRQRNRGSDWYGMPLLSYNTEDGMIVGAMAMVNKFNFRVKPYDYSLSMSASYASGTRSHKIAVKGIFNSIIRGSSVHMQVLKTQLLFNDYYGFGNDTGFDDLLEEEDYYETEEEFYIFRTSVHFGLFKNSKASVGISFTNSDTELNQILLLRDNHHYRYGLGKFNSFDISASMVYDSRDNAANAHKGIFLKLDASYTPKLFDNRYSYFKAGFDVRTYLTFKLFTPMTLALRLGGAKNFGDYPFFSAVFLGGVGDLRGYNKKRFAGDAAAFGQVELRAYLGKIKLILPGEIGFHLFNDTGRVFTDGITSDTLHNSYGGGIWIAFANRMVSTSFTYAKSEERALFYIALKLMY
jgi:Omp85 superfamily domain